MPRSAVNLLCVAVPKLLAGVCTLALNLVLLRYLAPNDYGLYALCITAVLLADAIVGSAVDTGVLRLAPLQREAQPAECLAIQQTALLAKLAVVGGAAALLCGFAGPLGRAFFHQPGQERLLYVSAAAMVGLLLLRSAEAHPQVAERFWFYGLLELVHLVAKFGGLALLLAFAEVSPVRVLVFFAAAPLLASAVWVATLGRQFRNALARLDLALELWRYIRWYLLTFGLAAIISRLDILLVARWATLGEVGIFSAGQVVAWVPQLLGTYLAVVLAPRIMPYWQDGRFFGFFRSIQVVLFAAGAAALAAGYFLLPRLGPVLLPPAFLKSLTVIMVLLPGALAGLVTFPLTLNFVLFIRPKFLFVMDCLTLPFLLLAFWYAIPRHGAVGAAWVTTIANVSRAGIAQIMAWRWASGNRGAAQVRIPALAASGVAVDLGR